jgi:hypothetical protein
VSEKKRVGILSGNKGSFLLAVIGALQTAQHCEKCGERIKGSILELAEHQTFCEKESTDDQPTD